MSVSSGQAIATEFTISNPSTGAATNADSTPTGTLYVNGVADAAVVTVTNLSTGLYSAAFTLPTLAVGDRVELSLSATVGGTTGKAVPWKETKDAVQGFSVAALAQFFLTATGEEFADAVAQSVVYEIRQGVTTGPGLVLNNSASGKTLETSATGYLAPSEFLKRADVRTIADLCSDTGSKIGSSSDIAAMRTALLTDDNLAACLLDASGMVEAACLVGKRYAVADLTALAGAASGLLFRLLTQLTVVLLYARRPGVEMKQPWIYEQAMKDLEALSVGQRLFSFLEVEAAGLPGTQEVNFDHDEARNRLSARTNRRFNRAGKDRDP